MKKTTLGNLIIVAAAIAIILAIAFLPLRVEAANKDPYCRITYDSAVGAYTIKYYTYQDGVAQLDGSRYIKYVNGVIADGNNEIISISQMSGTDACWTPDGNYLVWIESDGSLMSRKYGTEANTKLASDATAVNLNSNDMLKIVSFKDGTSKSAKDLFGGSSSGNSGSGSGSGNSGNTGSGSSGSGNSGSGSGSNSGSSTTVTPVKEWTDSAGQEHFQFGTHQVLVEGKNIYLDEFRISELCESGVRYVGVDASNRVYLYEDATGSFYRFSLSNIFQPEKIKFMAGIELQSAKADKKTGRLTSVVTSIGTYTVEQLVADTVWYPTKNYAVNKAGYCQYYIAETSTVHLLELKGTTLYLDGKKIATGIKRPTESFGFKGAYYYYLKGNKAYRAKLSAPTKVKVWKKKVKKLTFSTTDGTVSGAK